MATTFKVNAFFKKAAKAAPAKKGAAPAKKAAPAKPAGGKKKSGGWLGSDSQQLNLDKWCVARAGGTGARLSPPDGSGSQQSGRPGAERECSPDLAQR